MKEIENLNIDVKFFGEYLVNLIYDTSDFDINDNSELKVSPLRLQNFLYCAYVYALTMWNKKLWNDSFEKWIIGPIISEFYHDYSKNGVHLIDRENIFVPIPELTNLEKFDLEALTVELNEKYNDSELAKLVHDNPWQNTKANSKIKDEDIIKYYSKNETFFDAIIYDPSLESPIKFLS